MSLFITESTWEDMYGSDGQYESVFIPSSVHKQLSTCRLELGDVKLFNKELLAQNRKLRLEIHALNEKTPTAPPTKEPTKSRTNEPSKSPTDAPTMRPTTLSPTSHPTTFPSALPTNSPTIEWSAKPKQTQHKSARRKQHTHQADEDVDQLLADYNNKTQFTQRSNSRFSSISIYETDDCEVQCNSCLVVIGHSSC